MKSETLKTIYNIIEHTNNHINDILENCRICKSETRHALMEHIDNLYKSICVLEKLGEEETEVKIPDVIERPMISRKTA